MRIFAIWVSRKWAEINLIIFSFRKHWNTWRLSTWLTSVVRQKSKDAELLETYEAVVGLYTMCWFHVAIRPCVLSVVSVTISAQFVEYQYQKLVVEFGFAFMMSANKLALSPWVLMRGCWNQKMGVKRMPMFNDYILCLMWRWRITWFLWYVTVSSQFRVYTYMITQRS